MTSCQTYSQKHAFKLTQFHTDIPSYRICVYTNPPNTEAALNRTLH